MRTFCFSRKSIPLKGLVFALGIVSLQLAFADTCPNPDDITDSLLEDPMDWSIYLSPGWHSDLVHEDASDIVAFDKVYADRFGPKCVFDTDSGRVSMFPTQDPDSPKGVDIAELTKNKMWYCDPQLVTNNPGNEQVCVCNDSVERCTFTFTPMGSGATLTAPMENTETTTTRTVIQAEQ